MSHELAAFEADLRAAPFMAGSIAGHWRLIDVTWPTARIALQAAVRDVGPTEWTLKFRLDGYPAQAPSAVPCDAAGALLTPERWPGGTAAAVFRPEWSTIGLYLPCDRVALEGHPDWRMKYHRRRWAPEVGVACYLRQAHAVLNSPGYTGVRAA